MKQVIHIFGASGSGTSTLAAAGYDTGGVEMRSKAMHDAWSRKLSCPVLVLDGTQPRRGAFGFTAKGGAQCAADMRSIRRSETSISKR